MQRISLVLCLSLGIFGCDALGGKSSEGDGKATAEAPATAASAAGGKAGGAPPPAKLNSNGVPMITAEKSTPPTLDEWKSAPEVNTQGQGSRPADCYMKVLREWLKVNCTGDIKGITDMDGFGVKGSDYYEYLVPGKVADYIVRLRKGSSLKLKILRADQDAALFVSWPPSAEQPLHVALGIGRR